MKPPVTVQRSGPVTTISLERPRARNAVDGPMAAALAEAFRAFGADGNAAVALLCSRGGVFCASADFKALGGPHGTVFRPDGTPRWVPPGCGWTNRSSPLSKAMR